MNSDTTFNPQSLQHYMFTKKHIMKLYIDGSLIKKREEKKSTPIPIKKKEKRDETFYIPHSKDKLFWCYYILMNGLDSYQLLDTKKFIEEKEQKIHLVEKLRAQKNILKKYKWKKNAIEADLVYSNEISIDTFMCICAISNINIAIIRNRCMYTLEDQTGDIQIIEHRANGFGCHLLDKEKIEKKYEHFSTTLWKIENIKKPLSAISSYKISSLHDICHKLNLPIKNVDGKKLKKKDLYESIKSNI